MINHARTLLLNQSRQQTHYSDMGYEYIPPTFKPIEMPTTLNVVRQILFGAKPDNYFRNFRCHEFLSYIHATELANYIYNLDARVTYWPETNKPYFEPANKRVLITQVYGSPRRLAVVGDLHAIASTGKAFNQYTVTLRNVTIDSQNRLQFEVKYLGKRRVPSNAIITDSNAPPIIALPETNLSVRLNTRDLAPVYSRFTTKTNDVLTVETYSPATGLTVENNEETPPLNDGAIVAQWVIETKVNPITFLTTGFPALEMLGEPAFLELFGVGAEEPYNTFKNLWFDHPLPAYKLSGIVLALIYRTEELRDKNG